MKKLPYLTIALAGLLALSACSKKEEPAITESDVKAAAEAAAAKATAESDAKTDAKLEQLKAESENALDAKKAAMEKKLAEQKAKMEAERAREQAAMEEKMVAQLTAESESMRTQFSKQNEALKKQLDSITKKYNSLKAELPEDTKSMVNEMLPELETKLSGLDTLIATYSPVTIEELMSFQSEYKNEIDTAKNIADEILKILGQGSVEEVMSGFGLGG